MEKIFIVDTSKNDEHIKVFENTLKLFNDNITILTYNERMNMVCYKQPIEDIKYNFTFENTQNMFDSCAYLTHLEKFNISTKCKGGFIFVFVSDNKESSIMNNKKVARLQFQKLKLQGYKLFMACGSDEMFNYAKYIGFDIVVKYTNKECLNMFEKEIKLI